MGNFPETYDDLQCREILQLSVWGGGEGTLVPLTIQTTVKCRVFVEQYLR